MLNTTMVVVSVFSPITLLFFIGKAARARRLIEACDHAAQPFLKTINAHALLDLADGKEISITSFIPCRPLEPVSTVLGPHNAVRALDRLRQVRHTLHTDSLVRDDNRRFFEAAVTIMDCCDALAIEKLIREVSRAGDSQLWHKTYLQNHYFTMIHADFTYRTVKAPSQKIPSQMPNQKSPKTGSPRPVRSKVPPRLRNVISEEKYLLVKSKNCCFDFFFNGSCVKPTPHPLSGPNARGTVNHLCALCDNGQSHALSACPNK